MYLALFQSASRAGLVNVLADGENTYLYGDTIVAEVSDTQTGFHPKSGRKPPDVLGSVRPMVSLSGEVQLSQHFAPFGEVNEKYGDGEATLVIPDRNTMLKPVRSICVHAIMHLVHCTSAGGAVYFE